jgi:hypothetical protein
LKEVDMPQIKLLEKKLENSLKKIERIERKPSLIESTAKNLSNVKFSEQKS